MAQEELYTQILLEELMHKIKILAEGYQMLSERIDRLSNRVETLEKRMDFAGLPTEMP